MTLTAEQIAQVVLDFARSIEPDIVWNDGVKFAVHEMTRRLREAGYNLDGPPPATSLSEVLGVVRTPEADAQLVRDLAEIKQAETRTTGVIRGIFEKHDGRPDIGQMVDDLLQADRMELVKLWPEDGMIESDPIERSEWREVVTALWAALQESEK